jgi:alpha,alpha-trehalase
MKKIITLVCLLNALLITKAQTVVATPDKIYSQLFHEVQMQKILGDGKTFVDCIPKRKPADIMYDYGMQKGPGFNLKKFIDDNFEMPRTPQLNYITQEKDVVMHIKNLWGVLKREADKPVEGSSLLPLPNAYIVPGGRFREIYYWDSYFTMLGLKESGETVMIENMIKNFAYLINTYGHIPNGNRSYYVSKSQPPFFALMVELLAGIKGDAIYKTYLPALEKEYAYWMDGAALLKAGNAGKCVVKLIDGTLLNRYFDSNITPRQESYKEDVETAETVANETMARIRFATPEAADAYRKKIAAKVYAQLRAGAASGWDFSSRWFADEKNITSIQTTDIVPVDLNCLLYQLELTISHARILANDNKGAAEFKGKAEARQKAIDKYCFNKTLRYYTDYNYVLKKTSNMVTPAGMYPFCVFENNRQGYMSLLARDAAKQIQEKLLKDGGILSTTNNTGQQWDAPNGWAPLQWMTIWGLDRNGQKGLARDIAQRWVKLNTAVFARTGKLMEKYNVSDTKLDAGGGEYPSQDGFGWTNGVLLALMKKYDISN